MAHDRNKAWGFSLFGDDLRQEVGGKISLMGMYQQDMIFQSETTTLPVIAPKFVIFIFYYEIQNAIEADITFKVSLGNESNLITEAPFLRKDLPPVKEPEIDPDNPDEAERIFHARIPIVISPFMIEKPGRLRVRAHYTDGNILKLGSIAIKLMSAKELQELVASIAQQTPKEK